MPEILSSLEKYDVTAERKSIYDDLEALQVFGMGITGEQKIKTYYYRVGKRDFDYLIGFDCEPGIIKHYRVDKILKIDLTEEKRTGKEFIRGNGWDE